MGGTPGYPHPDLGFDLDEGYPGVPPHLDLGWGTPHQEGWETPHQLDGVHPLPISQMRVPPSQKMDRHTPVKT